MGSGKSHTGKRLAELLKFDFIDLDDEIESAAGKSISEIFASDGEKVFRRTERDVLRATAGRNRTVIATGGGAPCFHDGINWMNAHGTSVFLDPPLSVLITRLTAGRDHRPLIQAASELQTDIAARLIARRPTYEKAQIHLRPTDPNDDVARLLFVYFNLRPLVP